MQIVHATVMTSLHVTIHLNVSIKQKGVFSCRNAIFVLHVCKKELLTAVVATKEGDRFSCMMGKIGKLPTSIELEKVHQAIFIYFNVCLQFNEFHLAIVRTFIHCQIKGMSKQLYFNLTSSDL